MSKLTQKKREIADRVEKILPKEKSVLSEMKEKRRENLPEKKYGLLRSKKFLDLLYNELTLADIKLKPEEFSVIWLVLTFIPSGLVALLSGEMLSAVTLAVVGAGLPVFIVRSRKKKRTIAFEVQLGDALIVICNCLRSGLSFQQAMEAIVKEMGPPVSVEFGRVLQEMQYGVPLEEGLNNMTERLKSADLLLTVSAVNIQRQTGGNLSEILEIISETIKERIKIKGDIRTLTAQGRMSGMLIGGLPIVMGGMLMITNPAYMLLLFTTPLGRMLLIVAVTMEVLGFTFIKKIVDIKY
ncbi:MAG: type II secretion system F family protein [Clostridiales bacterium]|nr:type II secretion system F family protein [Clostridiales bacterium]